MQCAQQNTRNVRVTFCLAETLPLLRLPCLAETPPLRICQVAKLSNLVDPKRDVQQDFLAASVWCCAQGIRGQHCSSTARMLFFV